jgi:hypothetical protein
MFRGNFDRWHNRMAVLNFKCHDLCSSNPYGLVYIFIDVIDYIGGFVINVLQ